MPAATASRTLWYAMPLCFFDNVTSGFCEELMMDSLSPKTFTGPSIGMPNHRNLYHSASNISTAVFIAINSLPNVDDSTVFCRLLYHEIGALLMNIKIPVCDLLVTLLLA